MKYLILLISLFSIFFILVFNVKGYTQTEREIKNDQDTILSVSSGEQLVEKYGCLACHKIYGPKIGPAYNGVSMKYRKEFTEKAADSIAFYIKNGSKGKYPCFMTKDAVMPPFNIPEVERMVIEDRSISLRPMKDMYRKQDEEKE